MMDKLTSWLNTETVIILILAKKECGILNDMIDRCLTRIMILDVILIVWTRKGSFTHDSSS